MKQIYVFVTKMHNFQLYFTPLKQSVLMSEEIKNYQNLQNSVWSFLIVKLDGMINHKLWMHTVWEFKK